jgi:hypothetical protein
MVDGLSRWYMSAFLEHISVNTYRSRRGLGEKVEEEENRHADGERDEIKRLSAPKRVERVRKPVVAPAVSGRWRVGLVDTEEGVGLSVVGRGRHRKPCQQARGMEGSNRRP